jgi:transposase-like protein
MGQAIDEHLDPMAELDQADRRNGSYRRHLLTEAGEIELAVPRTRRFAPITVGRAYARRAAQLDRMILASFVLGLSVRKSLPSRKRGSARRCCLSWDGRSARQR